jgi:hypothetical protein
MAGRPKESTMHTATELLHRQLHAYSDSWRQERERAQAPWEVEAWLETGLSIFRLIRRLDEHLGGAEVGALYEQWLRNAAGPLGRLNELESQGCPVADAGDFREAEREARGVLHVPLDGALADARPGAAIPDVTETGLQAFPA